MVDQVRVQRLLRGLSDDIAFLRRESDASPSRRADEVWLRGVKYSFITAIEAAVDVAQHISATRGWGPPSDNGDAMRVLGRNGVLDIDHADHMRRAVGFRNVLVHDYVDVDDTVVISRLGDLSDLSEFVSAIASYLTTSRDEV
ncbi:type VII toxin-antitoxin system HepT family RNase toxin [Luteipulveratus halotolerans]|uniref:DUF86 domain-containing protein n=1 Tax=Luteipulveratus halotolerans TaxID=1631356 RepID=A0A0L6CLP1_9MICO|nr:HepT-like ribonuclease domain-containing protein [Luteipulveratus halotolerans]KNX38672.1 hypothetical protein VV01_18415 [Luteipulveratus halotolerans]